MPAFSKKWRSEESGWKQDGVGCSFGGSTKTKAGPCGLGHRGGDRGNWGWKWHDCHHPQGLSGLLPGLEGYESAFWSSFTKGTQVPLQCETSVGLGVWLFVFFPRILPNSYAGSRFCRAHLVLTWWRWSIAGHRVLYVVGESLFGAAVQSEGSLGERDRLP